MKNILILILPVLLLGSEELEAQYSDNDCLIKSEFIYRAEDVNFPSCHASTITEISGGLLAAWFGGTAERNKDVTIWISRYEGDKWSLPVEVANGIQHKDKRYPCWNPVLFNTGKEILLFYKAGPSPSEWWGEMKISNDNGSSWSRSFRLPEDIIGPVKNKPVMLSSGELLCPSSTEHDGWRVHMEITSDNGVTWERTAPLNEKNIDAIQPAILTHPDGKIQILCRSKQSQILSSWSEDSGRHWSPLAPSGIPNPNSGLDAVTLKDGRHLLVYNHLKTGRNILNIAVSADGINWEAVIVLENDTQGKEYSYPAVIQSGDGMVHITYTWNRKLIKHVVIDPLLIDSKPFENDNWPGN